MFLPFLSYDFLLLFLFKYYSMSISSFYHASFDTDTENVTNILLSAPTSPNPRSKKSLVRRKWKRNEKDEMITVLLVTRRCLLFRSIVFVLN
jgi:hypothetical protein